MKIYKNTKAMDYLEMEDQLVLIVELVSGDEDPAGSTVQGAAPGGQCEPALSTP